MAGAGSVLLDDQGRWRYHADGRLHLSDGAGDACCCAAPCPDFDVGTPIPRIIRVTFAGITDCGCVDSPGIYNDSSAKLVAGTLNGVWDLTRLTGSESWYTTTRGYGLPFGCAWGYNAPVSSLEARFYNNLGCNPAYYDHTDRWLDILIESRNSFYARIQQNTYNSSEGYLFQGGNPGDTTPPGHGWTRAAFPQTYPNLLAACGNNGPIVTGGTATIEAIF